MTEKENGAYDSTGSVNIDEGFEPVDDIVVIDASDVSNARKKSLVIILGISKGSLWFPTFVIAAFLCYFRD